MAGLLVSILLLITLAHANNFQVNVGQGALVYSPNTVSANIGDTVEFIFDGVRAVFIKLTFLDAQCS